MGYNPEIILAGRRLNDSMGAYVVTQLIKAMIKKGIQIAGSRVLIMGLTFKENCPDTRNSRIIDIVSELQDFNCLVDVYDPWISVGDVNCRLNMVPVKCLTEGFYDAIVVAVPHDEFKAMGIDAIRVLCKPLAVLYDLKSIFDFNDCDLRL